MALPEFNDLWTKAKLFARRALSSSDTRDEDERMFWATTSLEFLAKAALARLSPLLIVPPDADGKHVLATLGVIAHDGANIQTIQAKALWSRAELTFKPFSAREAKSFSDSRNEYMHGGGTGTPSHPADVWWGKFWNQASILVIAADQDLHGLVGPANLTQVEAYLSRHRSHVKEHVAALLMRAQQRLDQRDSPSTPAARRDELNKPFYASGQLTHISSASCPVCGEDGSLEGELSGSLSIDWPSDPWDTPMETVEVHADYFGCPNCWLVLDRAELLEEAGVPTTFSKEQEYDPADYDYGND